MNENQIVLEVDEQPAVQPVNKANAALETYEKAAVRANDSAAKAFSQSGETAVRVMDRSRSSAERLIASLEKKATFAGLDKVGQLQQLRDIDVKRVAGDPAAVDRVTAAYAKLITVEKQVQSAAMLDRAQAASKRAEAATLQFDRALQKVNETAKQEALDHQNDLLKAAVRASQDAARASDAFNNSLLRQNKVVADGIANLERRAKYSGKTGAQIIDLDEAEALKKFGTNAQNIERVRAAFAVLRAEEEKHSGLATKIGNALRDPINGARAATDGLINSWGTVGLVVGGAAIAVAGAAKHLYDWAVAAGKSAEQTANFADRLDISIQKAQEYQISAKIAGVDVGALEAGTRLLSAALEDSAGQGEKTALALRKLHVSLVDVNTGAPRELGQVMTDVLDRLAEIPKASERIKLLNDILGRGSKELVPWVKHLSETKALASGLVLNERFIEDLAKADDRMDVLDEKWSHLKGQISAEFTVPLVDSLQKGVGSIMAMREAWSALFGLMIGKKGAQPSNQPKVETPKVDTADVERGAKLQADFAKTQILSTEQLNTKLGDLKKKYESLFDTLAGKKGQITGSAFDAKRKELDDLKKQIKDVESALLSPELKKKAVENRKASQEALIQARADYIASLGGDDRARDILRLRLEKEKEIRQRSTITDSKGIERRVTLDNETRLNIEKAYALKLQALDAQRFQKRLEGEAEAAKAQIDLREKSDQALEQKRTQLFQESHQIQIATIQRVDDMELTALERSRDMQLRGLDMVNAQTLRQKLTVEAAKLAIEDDYIRKSTAKQIDILQRRTELEIQEKQRAARDVGATDAELNNIRWVREQELQQKIEILNLDANDRIAKARDAATIRSRDLQIEAARKMFDSIKQQAGTLIDALWSRTQSFGDAVKNTLKAAFLTPIKDALSTRIAAVLTGAKLEKADVPDGPFKGLREILAKIGVGAQPRFQTKPIDNVTLTSDRALRVYVTNQAGQSNNPVQQAAQAAAGGGIGGGAMAGLAGLAIGGGLGLGQIFSRGGVPAGQSSVVFTDTSGNPIPGAAASKTFGGRLGGFFGKLPGLGGLFGGGPGELPLSSHTGFFDPISGQLVGGTASKAGFFSSKGGAGDLALMGGIALGADGLRRGGGIGMLETTAAGAMIGFKFGGPLGAAIGAGVGAAVGGLRWAFGGKPFEQQVIDKVKSKYSLTIEKGFAKQLAQTIKQNYNGDIDRALGSKEIMDMLSLYAQNTGQKFGVANQARPYSLANQNGKTVQDAIYINGAAYSQQSRFDVLGGIPTSVISPAGNQSVYNPQTGVGEMGPAPYTFPVAPAPAPAPAPDPTIKQLVQSVQQLGKAVAQMASTPVNVGVKLDGAATTAFVQGQQVHAIETNPRAVQDASSKAIRSNYNRPQARNDLFTPGVLASV